MPPDLGEGEIRFARRQTWLHWAGERTTSDSSAIHPPRRSYTSQGGLSVSQRAQDEGSNQAGYCRLVDVGSMLSYSLDQDREDQSFSPVATATPTPSQYRTMLATKSPSTSKIDGYLKQITVVGSPDDARSASNKTQTMQHPLQMPLYYRIVATLNDAVRKSTVPQETVAVEYFHIP